MSSSGGAPSRKQAGSRGAQRPVSSLEKARATLAASRAAGAAAGSPVPCPLPASEEAASAISAMAAASTKAALRPCTTAQTIMEPEWRQTANSHHMVQDKPSPDHITGNRIASMDTFQQQVMPHLACPACRAIGALEARADDELSSGLAGTVHLYCPACERCTLAWEQSSTLGASST